MDSGSIIFRRPLFAKSKLSATACLDSTLMLYLWTMSTGPTVASIIDFVSMWATTSSWIVEITSKSEKLKTHFTDDVLNRTFAQQCTRKLELMVQHALIFGWVAVQYTVKDGIKQDKVTGGDIILNVLHPYEYEPRWKKSKRGNIKWIAYNRMNSIGEDNAPIPRSRVFMMRPPEPITGKMTSPLMLALRSIFQYDEAFALEQIVANKLAFPLFISRYDVDKTIIPNTNTTRAATVTGHSLVGSLATDPSGAPLDVGLAPVSQEFLQYWNARDAQQRMVNLLEEQATQREGMTMQMFQMPRRNVDSLHEFVRTAVENPTLPCKLLGPGIGYEPHVPEAKSGPNFETIEEVLKIQICTLLGVPVEFIFGGGKFASDIALNRKIMETRTTRMHAWLSEVLAEIFLDIHFVDVYERVEAFSSELGLTEALAVAGHVDRDTYLTAGVVLKNKWKVLIEQDLLVSVQFAETTSASEESLLRAFQTGVIDLEKYQQLMLATLGIPQSAKAKLSKDKIKELEEHVRGLDAPQTPGGAGAKTAAPKSKTDKVRTAGERKKPAKKAKSSDNELRSLEKKQKSQTK